MQQFHQSNIVEPKTRRTRHRKKSFQLKIKRGSFVTVDKSFQTQITNSKFRVITIPVYLNALWYQ